jgi:hypothetical protein
MLTALGIYIQMYTYTEAVPNEDSNLGCRRAKFQHSALTTRLNPRPRKKKNDITVKSLTYTYRSDNK